MDWVLPRVSLQCRLPQNGLLTGNAKVIIIATIISFRLSTGKNIWDHHSPDLSLYSLSVYLPVKKNYDTNESVLHGTWVKGSNVGDTLWFMKKNGQHIMRVPDSFNPMMPAYSEKEYRLNGEVLSIKSFAPTSQEYFQIESFKWTDPGKEFTITNSQLFIFMSSIVTYKYRKI